MNDYTGPLYKLGGFQKYEPYGMTGDDVQLLKRKLDCQRAISAKLEDIIKEQDGIIEKLKAKVAEQDRRIAGCYDQMR